MERLSRKSILVLLVVAVSSIFISCRHAVQVRRVVGALKGGANSRQLSQTTNPTLKLAGKKIAKCRTWL
jgi:hypothetical protein